MPSGPAGCLAGWLAGSPTLEPLCSVLQNPYTRTFTSQPPSVKSTGQLYWPLYCQACFGLQAGGQDVRQAGNPTSTASVLRPLVQGVPRCLEPWQEGALYKKALEGSPLEDSLVLKPRTQVRARVVPAKAAHARMLHRRPTHSYPALRLKCSSS